MSTGRTMPSLCFVIPYFGRWPFWMPFFLAGCRANPTVDWLLFSDCGPLPDCPSNVRVIETSYAAYCDRVSARLGIDFHPSNPYKLCDLKPALGYIHEAELATYDFWAFGDLDLVFGDLRAYFHEERLAGKDVFSTHERRISGHCCLLRNTQELRELFLQMKDWRTRLAMDRHEGLDEGAFSRIFIRRKNWPRPLARLFWRLNPWYRRAEFIEAYSTPDAKVPWVDGSRNFPARWFWRDGVLTNDRDGGRTFPYVHFLVWKGLAWKQLNESVFATYPSLAREPAWQVSAQGFEPLVTRAGET